MKKIFTLTLLFLMVGGYATVCARTQYDSTGRHIIYDDSLRGRRQAAQLDNNIRKTQAAAAAKINYDEKYLDNKQNSTYYQNSEAYKK